VLLESLSPLERAVFVLHEVFGYPHEEIAGTWERSSASVRQLAHHTRGPGSVRLLLSRCHGRTHPVA